MNEHLLKMYRTKSGLVASVLLALAFAFCSVAGLNLRLSDSSDWVGNPLLFFVGWVVIAFVFFIAESALWVFLDKRAAVMTLSRKMPLVAHPKRWSIFGGVIIFACWLPILFAGWPGFFNYDAGLGSLMQWGQIQNGTFNAHHPVLHTLYLKYSVGFGQALFGTFNAGIAFSVIVQAVVIAGFFSFFIYYLLMCGMGGGWTILCIAYYALNPIIGMFAFAATKDVLSAALLVTFCLMCWHMYQMASTNQKPKITFWIGLLVVTALLLVLRSNFIVAIILGGLVILCIIPITIRKTFLIVMGLSFVLAMVWLAPLAQVMHVQKSPIGIWNALCVPEQQLARVGTVDGVAEEDQKKINEALPDLRYKQNLSDVARRSFMNKNVSTGELVSLYAEMGLKYPEIYLDAFLLQTEDAWSRFAVINCYASEDGATDVFQWKTFEPGTQDTLAPRLESFYKSIAQAQGIESIPVVGLVVSIAFYLLVLALCFVRAVTIRSKEGLLFVAVLVFASLTNLLGPCMLIRYFLYLVYALPILIWLIVNEKGAAGKRAMHERTNFSA